MDPASNTENILFPIDLSIFKEHIKLSFSNILDSLPKTPKTLIIEQTCMRKLDFFIDFPLLEEKGVKRGVLYLTRNPLDTDSPNLIYVISPNKNCLENILFQIENHRKDGVEKKYTVVFIPKINYDCQNFIDKFNLRAELNLHNLPIDIIPLDKDIISLEAYDTIPELFLKGDTNILSVLSRVIIKFETVFGKIKYKYAKGDYAKILKKILENEEEISPFETDSEILASIILDRSVDYITPLCSQYTYEGMLEEFIGISYNTLRVNPQILEKEGTNEIKIDVSSKDKFYSKIRDFNFNHLRSYLPNKLEEHKQILAEGSRKDQNLTELSRFLDKVKAVKEESPSVATHINLADYIKYLRFEQNLLVGGDIPSYIYEFYENEMGKKSDFSKFLRLMCIESIVQSGLKARVYDQIKRDFLNVYGYQEIFLLRNLEKLKILKKQDGRNYYDYINENLRLIKEDVNINEPDDCSYVFGGFCPISIRLIEAVVKRGWSSMKEMKEVLKKLPGDFEFPANEKEIVFPRNKPGFVLLVFIGGITHAEISAIRYLNRTSKDHKFIMLTTHITSSKKFIESLREKFEPSLTMKDYYSQIKELENK